MTLQFPSVRNRQAAYWRVPAVSFLIGQAAGAPVGIARGALAAFMERLPGRRITYTDYAEQSHAPVTHLQVGEAMMKIHSADAHGRSAIELAAGAPDGEYTLADRALLRAHAAHATALARDAVDVLYRASGASAIQGGVPIQRYQRDIQALANHAFLSDATSLELLGRITCGLEPNTVFI
jgi:alkylation response protein AidB-like acyl-CoA dehydrogenase